MYGSVRGLVTVAKELGVKFRFRTTIKRAHLSHGRIQVKLHGFACIHASTKTMTCTGPSM